MDIDIIILDGGIIVGNPPELAKPLAPEGAGEGVQSFILRGDFDNRSTNLFVFNWSDGSLSLDGVAQAFEVAGQDVGTNSIGLNNNFGIGTLEVTSTANVTFADTLTNAGDGVDPEALYVRELALRSGSTVTLDGVNLYYWQLTDEGATITLKNGGAMLQIGPCTDNASCDDGNVCTFDKCSDVSCSHDIAKYGDTARAGGTCQPDGIVDLQDILAVLNAFQGIFGENCTLRGADLVPCEGNDLIDLSDILAALDAFQGTDNCCAEPP